MLLGTMEAMALDFGFLVLEIGDLIPVVGLLSVFWPGLGEWQEDPEGAHGEKQAFQGTHTCLSAVRCRSNRPRYGLVLFSGSGEQIERVFQAGRRVKLVPRVAKSELL